MEALKERKQALFSELSELVQKVKALTSTIDAKVYEKRVTSLEVMFRSLHQEILVHNVGKDKKECVNVSDMGSLLDSIDFVNKRCLMVLDAVNSGPPKETVHVPTLQSLQIPVFSGVISEWENFDALFNALVHTNKSLDNVVKLQYLRLFTSKEAHATVSGFPLLKDQYEPAYNALRERYANLRRIASYHSQKLLCYDKRDSNASKLLDTLKTSTAALRNLKLPDLADFLLFQICYNNCDQRLQNSFDNDCTKEIPTLSDLLYHVEKRARTLELITDNKKADNAMPPRQRSRSHVTQEQVSSKCKCCNQDHNIYRCPKFSNLSHIDKLEFVKTSRLCFNCLGNHAVKFCHSKARCSFCKRSHHSLLHSSDLPSKESSPPKVAMEPASVLSCVADEQILLATIQCKIQDSFGYYHKVNALLDNASQRNLVTSRLINKLGLEPIPESRTILGVGGRKSSSRGLVTLSLHSRLEPCVTYDVQATILPHICEDIPTTKLAPQLSAKFSKLPLADGDIHRKKSIDILLGADAYADLLSDEEPNLIPGQPAAQRTIFGWVLFGRTAAKPTEGNTNLSMLVRSIPLDTTLTRFWEIEAVSAPVSNTNPEDDIAEEHFVKTHSRDSNGRYILRLPFRPGAKPDELSNHAAADRCLWSLEKKLNRQPVLKKQYTAFMQEFVDLQHMEETTTPSSYVLPHHCVFKESTSTKLRCVFNASAKDVRGKSLNELLLAGPKLQADIADILIRFRFHNVALCSDIKMMFRQMMIHPEDRKYQHILWEKYEESPPLEFEINRLVYGMTSSSFLAQRTLRQLSIDEGKEFPAAANVLRNDFYMDDFVGGAKSVAAARELRQELTQLLEKGGFPLLKWISSHPAALDDLPASHKESPLEINAGDPMFKILGLCYIPQSDSFGYRIQFFNGPITKRTVLSYVSRCYDPFGLLCGVICRAKCLIQQLWLLRNDWDADLPEPLLKYWKEFLKIIEDVPNIRIPRCFNVDNATLRLVCFCDASTTAYAACIYLHVQRDGADAEVFLIKAKSRVAPLKVQSVPRLELLGSLLAAQLLTSVKEATPHYDYASVHMLTDSTIVLTWLKTSPHLLNTFVANRVVAIVDPTANCRWAHVPSEFNAADCASRGCIDHSIWWNGPAFLRLSPEHWNIDTVQPRYNESEGNKKIFVISSNSLY